TGSNMIITGYNLNEQNPPTVTFSNTSGGTVNAAIVGFSSGSITCTVPANIIIGPFKVANSNGVDVSTRSFCVPPAISSFNPAAAPPGTIVKVLGMNFLSNTAVFFNGQSASNFWITNNTTMGVGVPAGVITGPISAQNSAGTRSSSPQNFYGPPVI